MEWTTAHKKYRVMFFTYNLEVFTGNMAIWTLNKYGRVDIISVILLLSVVFHICWNTRKLKQCQQQKGESLEDCGLDLVVVVFAFDVVIKGNERFWSRVGFSLDYLICLRITISEYSKLTEIAINC